MFGDVHKEMIVKSSEFKKIREKIELTESKVYEKLKLNELIAICSNRISILLDFNISEYSVNNCDTTNQFITLMRKYDRYILK